MPNRFFAVCSILVAAAAVAEEPLEHQVKAYLEAVEGDYSAEHQMLGMPFNSPGYHTRVPNGTWVHPTRQSLDYAGALLFRNKAGDTQRAASIVRKVLSLQDTNSQHRTFGIWPWLLEEPLKEMDPPDWNWADFCGARLAVILHDYSDRLPEDLRQQILQSLGYAAQAIRRRDVKPSYTNIAIMGGGVCAAAGELSGDEEMLQYGRNRLQRTVEHARFHGGFNEYNSPTYTMVALWECERTLHLVRDQETRRAAEALRRIAWETVAGSFHPATAQWAGPHSRAYGDLLFRSVAEYLSAQTATEITVHPPKRDDGRARAVGLFSHLRCPEDLCSRFRRLPKAPLTLRRTFVRDSTGEPTVVGTTWLNDDACLGSVNQSSLWTQRRVLLGYWKTEADPAVVFRMRFLHDGNDFASMGAAIDQSGPRALVVLHPLRNHGDWHVSLDRPPDGIFQAKDLRLRFQLAGQGVQVRSLDAARFELLAGEHRVAIHTLAGRFHGQPIRWEAGQEDGTVFIDGICYQGERQAFDFRQLADVVVVAGVELLPIEQRISDTMPVVEASEPGSVRAVWSLESDLTVGASFVP
jgi:hypothetical protein